MTNNGKLPLFPTSVVGSWPRPSWLMDAVSGFQRGEISNAELERFMDDAVKLAIKDQETAGIDVLSDGEQRRISFLATIGERVEGFKLFTMLELAKGRSADARAKINELKLPSAVPQPIAVSKIRRTKPIGAHEFEFARQHTGRLVKVPLPSPYMLAWQAWDDRYSKHAYPTPEDLAEDLANVIREEIVALRDAGCTFVQLDDPTLTNPLMPDKYMMVLFALLGQKPRTPKEEFAWAVQLVNKTTRGVSGLRVGYHVCRGNWPAAEEKLPTQDYGGMLPALVEMNVDQLVLEFATHRAGPIDVFRDYANVKELGLGVIDVKHKTVESPEVIVERAKTALKYFDAKKLFLNPDCGFSSGRDWPVLPREIAIRKLAAMTEAAATLRKEYS